MAWRAECSGGQGGLEDEEVREAAKCSICFLTTEGLVEMSEPVETSVGSIRSR